MSSEKFYRKVCSRCIFYHTIWISIAQCSSFLCRSKFIIQLNIRHPRCTHVEADVETSRRGYSETKTTKVLCFRKQVLNRLVMRGEDFLSEAQCC